MPRKRFSTEQIITKLCEAEVAVSRGVRAAGLQDTRDQRADV